MVHRASISSERRVSFEGDEVPKRRCVGLTSRGMKTTSMVSPSTMGKKKMTRYKSTPLSILKRNEQQPHATVLHGRDLKSRNNETPQSQVHWDEAYSYRYSNGAASSIRNTFKRKHVFSQLSDEMKQFQQQVSSLEQFIKEQQQQPDVSSNLSSSTSSEVENGWRTRVLIKTAQEAEKVLWTKLYEYEKTLLVHPEPNRFSHLTQNDDLREAQTACMKLHRDFKRSHKALLMCVSLATGTDLVDGTSPQIDSVGWTGTTATTTRVKTDMEGGSVMSPHPDRCPIPPISSLQRPVSPDQYTSFRPLLHDDSTKQRTYHSFSSSQRLDNTADTSFYPLNEEHEHVVNRFRQCLGSLEEDGRCCHSDRTTGREDLDQNPWMMCGAFNFQNREADDVSSLGSSSRPNNKYHQWYKTIQDELHSIQLDLLHVRSNMVTAGLRGCNDSSSGSSDNSPLIDGDDDDNILATTPKPSSNKN
jgi:hypothetical protein